MADIFVSYTQSDKLWAHWIALELKKLGHAAHLYEWTQFIAGICGPRLSAPFRGGERSDAKIVAANLAVLRARLEPPARP
ncbi:MAG: hypothetical protein ACLPN5_07015 [Roseiarcus sp.]